MQHLRFGELLTARATHLRIALRGRRFAELVTVAAAGEQNGQKRQTNSLA